MPRTMRKSSYTAEDLENAIQAIIFRECNVRQAALRYEIPYETLRVKALKRRSTVVLNFDSTQSQNIRATSENIMRLMTKKK